MVANYFSIAHTFNNIWDVMNESWGRISSNNTTKKTQLRKHCQSRVIDEKSLQTFFSTAFNLLLREFS